VIGPEAHVQLLTASKIFTAASTAFGDDPNTHIDPAVCGLPGTLPVLNQQVLEFAVKADLALNLKIAEHSKFDRRQSFDADLPKNDQISHRAGW
jgi:aspartyl-tRNA(Asn)/glutamyl-tRNA(Gln) amidotransferase subunit B